jgi:hypothetical protein
MTPEPFYDEDDLGRERPATDPVRSSLLPVIEVIFAHTRDGSVERKAALDAVLSACDRIRAALAPKPRLQ